jgi:hypothetical protein
MTSAPDETAPIASRSASHTANGGDGSRTKGKKRSAGETEP